MPPRSYFPPTHGIVGLRDSKKISAGRREQMAVQVRRRAQLFAVASASVEEIDTLNILPASWTAMKRAVALLDPAAGAVPR